MITLEQLAFSYEQSAQSLRPLDLSIKEGECLVLCGKSGCGKTTFTRIINGLIPELYEGKLTGKGTVAGVKIGEAEIYEFAQKVGSVFQNPKTQFFTTEVRTELVFGCENLGIEKEEIERRLRETVAVFPIEQLLEKNMFQLSGGQKQMIAFAAAYMQQPDIFVLDEPSSNLDYQTIQLLGEQIAKLKKAGKTIIIAEHRLYYLKQLADRFLWLEQGQIKQLFSQEEFACLSESELHVKGLRTLRLEKMKRKQQHVQHAKLEEKLVIQQLTHRYQKKGQTVLEELNLTLSNQAIYGIVGSNGVGKTTLMQIICGLIKPSKGTIRLQGQVLKQRQLLKLSYLVMQDVNYQLFCETVEKELLLKATEPELFEEVVKSLNLQLLLKRHPMTLSGGQKQRVAVASALLSGKKIILFDEPTSGLDAYHMEQVSKLFGLLQRKGRFVLLVSHDVEFLAKTVQQIVHLQDKKMTQKTITEIPENGWYTIFK